MENQQTLARTGFATKKAVPASPPRPATSPTPAPNPSPFLSKMTQQRLSDSSGGSVSFSSSESTSAITSRSHASESSDSNSNLSSESGSGYDFDSQQQGQQRSMRGRVAGDFEQLPDRCLKDRCLRPLHKLQHHSFLPGGKEVDPKAQSSGLIWQDSGFMTPFRPELLSLKRGQSSQISTAATGVTTIHGLGRFC